MGSVFSQGPTELLAAPPRGGTARREDGGSQAGRSLHRSVAMLAC